MHYLGGINTIKTLIKLAVEDNQVLTSALRQLVDKYGFIDSELIPFIADSYNLSKAEVLGVISFYEDFRTTPPLAHVIRICQAEACQALGATTLMAHCKSVGLTNKQNVEIGTVSCLGLCACGPALIHNENLHARVTSAKLDEIIRQTQK
ncbi:MAG: NAD(P)H-dependent oxidoreductase subunit E [Pseudomonadales bacterium]|nr:NAD(P)H-dependent oxidoreductase subunit E [Pseudomonadales bacterium]